MDKSTRFNSFSHLDRLLANFDRLKNTAINLQSPNPEDDEFVRCGMVGFAQSLSLDHWTIEHFEYVISLRDEVMSEEYSLRWRQFACLARGYFMGMHVAGLIDDLAMRLAEAQTPGFTWLHSKAFQDSQSGSGRDGG